MSIAFECVRLFVLVILWNAFNDAHIKNSYVNIIGKHKHNSTNNKTMLVLIGLLDY